MICKSCRTRDHDHCVDIHLMNSGRNGCACQHRSGTFNTSVLNPDGTRTEGVFGATGARGSALTTTPPSSKITDDEDPYRD